jgi:Arc/MetJ-type ribon-helix-helix transcriptional regulator
MTIVLSPEQEKRVAEAMQIGGYQNPGEVIERALEILHREESWPAEEKDVIHNRIERAFAQFESGDFFTAEQSRSDMAKRKERWHKEQSR